MAGAVSGEGALHGAAIRNVEIVRGQNFFDQTGGVGTTGAVAGAPSNPADADAASV